MLGRLYLFGAVWLLLGSSDLNAQSLQWAHHFGGQEWDISSAIVVDDSGYVYATGTFKGTVDFDPGPSSQILTAQGTADGFVCKFNRLGELVWVGHLEGDGAQDCHALATDHQGNILVAGFFLGQTDFDPSAGTHQLISSPGGDAFIWKLNAAGQLVWAKQFTGTLAITAYGVAVDDSGDVYSTGFFDGTADFDPGPGQVLRTVAGYSDAFVAKLDADGNHQWVQLFAGNYGEVGHAIVLDQQGNVFTTGTFFGTADFDPGPNLFQLHAPGDQEIFLCKLDANGEFQWAQSLGGDVGMALLVDDSANVYTTGYFGWDDIQIFKFDNNGSLLWTKQIGAFFGNDLAMGSDGSVYIAGQFFDTRDFDPGPGQVFLTAIGSTDSYILKLSPGGGFDWVMQFGGMNEVKAVSLAIDDQEQLYLAGTFDSTADFDPGPGSVPLTSNGSYDIFLTRLSAVPQTVFQPEKQQSAVVYPNPVSGRLWVRFPVEQQQVQIRLMNLEGKTLEEWTKRKIQEAAFPVTQPSGIYLLEIVTEEHARTVQRVVVP